MDKYAVEYTLYRRKDSPNWCFAYYDEGKRKQRTTPFKAKMALSGKAGEYATKYLAELHKPTDTVRAFTANLFVWGECAWIARQHAKTKRFSRDVATGRRGILVNHIYPTFGDRTLSSINGFEVEDWLVRLKLSNSTRNSIIATFRIVFREAARQGIMPGVPVMELFGKSSVRRKAFTIDQLKILFAPGIDERWGSERMASLFLLMATTGIRLGEALAVNGDDFDDLGYVRITKALKNFGEIGPTKNGKGRAVIVDPAVARRVVVGPGRCFPINKHTPMRYFKRTMAMLGWEGYVVHSFRHTYQTLMSRESVLPPKVQRDLMGHTDERMTENYNQETLDDVGKRLLKFSSDVPVAGIFLDKPLAGDQSVEPL